MTDQQEQERGQQTARLAAEFIRHQYRKDGQGRVAVVTEVMESDLLPEFLQVLAETAIRYGLKAHDGDLMLILDHTVDHASGRTPPRFQA